MRLMRKVISKMPDKTVRKFPVGLKELTRIFPSLLSSVGVRESQEAWLWWLLSYAAMLRCGETARLLWTGVNFDRDDPAAEPSGVRFSLLVGEDEDMVFKTHANSVEFHLARQHDKHP